MSPRAPGTRVPPMAKQVAKAVAEEPPEQKPANDAKKRKAVPKEPPEQKPPNDAKKRKAPTRKVSPAKEPTVDSLAPAGDGASCGGTLTPLANVQSPGSPACSPGSSTTQAWAIHSCSTWHHIPSYSSFRFQPLDGSHL
jgi:hypothetical protein